jgi:hypothetical protein
MAAGTADRASWKLRPVASKMVAGFPSASAMSTAVAYSFAPAIRCVA